MVDFITGIFTLIGALGGVGLGYWLNEHSSNKKERKQLKSVRTLFNLEINDNLKLLNNFISKIKEDEEGDSEDYSLEILGVPFPPFKSIIWKEQNSFLVYAFNEEELVKIREFYNSIEQIFAIYTHIKNDYIQGNGDEMNPFFKSTMTPKFFYWGQYEDFAKEFMNLSEKLIKEGNPLK